VISRWRENPVWLQFLLGLLLFLFLTVLSYLIGLFQSSLPGMALFAKSNSTRTAIALTFQALMGPFPTATGPTPTASWTPSMTSTPTVTPSITPTPTRVRYFLNTSTPRTLVPGQVPTSIGAPTERPQPTRTSAPATPQPRATRTSGVQATDPPQQPTNPPRRPTKRPKKATKTPKPPKNYVPVAECIYVPGCYDYALRLENEYPGTQPFPGLLPLAIPTAIPDEP
jgi:hypothetical protein